VTSEERLDFKELRAEMREGFRDVKDALNGLTGRVDSLEATRDRAVGAQEAVAKRQDHTRTVSMWRTGLIVSVLTTGCVILADVILAALGIRFIL
jgi:hypothetical protein